MLIVLPQNRILSMYSFDYLGSADLYQDSFACHYHSDVSIFWFDTILKHPNGPIDRTFRQIPKNSISFCYFLMNSLRLFLFSRKIRFLASDGGFLSLHRLVLSSLPWVYLCRALPAKRSPAIGGGRGEVRATELNTWQNFRALAHHQHDGLAIAR